MSSEGTRLLPDSTLVESQLFTFEDIAVNTSTLARSAGHYGVQTTSLKLSLQSWLNLADFLQSLLLLGNNRLALLFLLFCLTLNLSPST